VIDSMAATAYGLPMGAGSQARGLGRGLFLTLCALALAMQVFVPPGFMVGGAPGKGHIVICTGHGPMQSMADLRGGPAPDHGKKSNPICPFAGHAPPLNLNTPGPLLAVAWTFVSIPRGARRDQIVIGRRLAAPPPARGPPVSLI
jgi:hypothetical protein